MTSQRVTATVLGPGLNTARVLSVARELAEA
jgi:hypothetical protein